MLGATLRLRISVGGGRRGNWGRNGYAIEDWEKAASRAYPTGGGVMKILTVVAFLITVGPVQLILAAESVRCGTGVLVDVQAETTRCVRVSSGDSRPWRFTV